MPTSRLVRVVTVVLAAAASTASAARVALPLAGTHDVAAIQKMFDEY